MIRVLQIIRDNLSKLRRPEAPAVPTAETVAAEIASDADAFAAWGIGEGDYPDAVNAALERIGRRLAAAEDGDLW